MSMELERLQHIHRMSADGCHVAAVRACSDLAAARPGKLQELRTLARMCLKDAIAAAVVRPHLWEATAHALQAARHRGLAPIDEIEGAEFVEFAASLVDLLRRGQVQSARNMCRLRSKLVELHAQDLKPLTEQMATMLRSERRTKIMLGVVVIATLVAGIASAIA